MQNAKTNFRNTSISVLVPRATEMHPHSSWECNLYCWSKIPKNSLTYPTEKSQSRSESVSCLEALSPLGWDTVCVSYEQIMMGGAVLIVRESSGRDKEENIGQADRNLKGYFKKSGNVHKDLCIGRRNVKWNTLVQGKAITCRAGNGFTALKLCRIKEEARIGLCRWKILGLF